MNSKPSQAVVWWSGCGHNLSLMHILYYFLKGACVQEEEQELLNVIALWVHVMEFRMEFLFALTFSHIFLWNRMNSWYTLFSYKVRVYVATMRYMFICKTGVHIYFVNIHVRGNV